MHAMMSRSSDRATKDETLSSGQHYEATSFAAQDSAPFRVEAAPVPSAGSFAAFVPRAEAREKR
jgi:hypothetical protein